MSGWRQDEYHSYEDMARDEAKDQEIADLKAQIDEVHKEILRWLECGYFLSAFYAGRITDILS